MILNLQRDGIEVLTPLYSAYHDVAQEGRELSMNTAVSRSRVTENGWRINVTPVRAHRVGAQGSIKHARAVVDWVEHVTDMYLGPGWGVNQYIWDYSGVTAQPLFPMHTDDFDGYRALKVYMYLQDCAEDQGPLMYRGRRMGGPAGTALVFDPSQEHGSYQVQRGSRYIFRAHMVERAYVLKHLPDQLPWYEKPISRVMRWMNKTPASS